MSKVPHERYVSKPFAGSSHEWAKRHLEALPSTARVLDIGPGSGVMGAFLRDRGVENLYAVEVDADCRSHVAPLYKEVHAELAPLQGRSYDAVLLLDVLEHMARPFEFLQEIAALLAPGGVVLVSVPNIAHWSIRLTLLFGRFEYTERGLLDKTHLQFFNRRRFNQLLQSQPGISVIERSASIEPVELLLPHALWDNAVFRALAKVRQTIAQFWPGLFAFQHLGLIKKQ